MTLGEMWKSVLRHKNLVVIASLIGLLASVALVVVTNMMPKQSVVVARIVTNDHSTGVTGFVAEKQRSYTEDETYKDYTIALINDTLSNTVSITVEGPDENTSKQIADDIAQTSLSESKAFYEGWENPFSGYTIDAREDLEASKKNSSPGLIKSVAIVGIATIAGFGIGAVAAILVDSKRRPIRSAITIMDALHEEDLGNDPDSARVKETLAKTPILDELPVTDGGLRLLANTRFAARNDNLKNICVVPLAQNDSSQLAAAVLHDAIEKEGACSTKTIACTSVESNITQVYKLRKADAVIISVKLWEDTVDSLVYAIKELSLAEVKLIGIVLVN